MAFQAGLRPLEQQNQAPGDMQPLPSHNQATRWERLRVLAVGVGCPPSSPEFSFLGIPKPRLWCCLFPVSYLPV